MILGNKDLKMFKERDALKVSLTMLYWSGQHPKHDNIRTRLVWISYVAGFAVTAPLTLMKLLEGYTDIDILAATLEAVTTCYQVICFKTNDINPKDNIRKVAVISKQFRV